MKHLQHKYEYRTTDAHAKQGMSLHARQSNGAQLASIICSAGTTVSSSHTTFIYCTAAAGCTLLRLARLARETYLALHPTPCTFNEFNLSKISVANSGSSQRCLKSNAVHTIVAFHASTGTSTGNILTMFCRLQHVALSSHLLHL